MVMQSKAVETPTRVIKRGTCPTVSGKSSITYQLGVDADDRLVLRIHSNDGGGFFSMEWIPFADILSALESWDADKPITSVALSKLIRGKSVNTSAFLLAALKAEGVLAPIEKKQRCHQLGDVDAFLAQAKALQTGKAAPQKKPPAKAKAAPTEKPTAKAAPSPAKGKKKSA
jgi:hypothetical protein